MTNAGVLEAYKGNLPKKKMDYDAQVIWWVDPSDKKLVYDGHCLQGKRVAIGDGKKSAVVFGLEPKWPEDLLKSAKVRLVVVAHGVPDALSNCVQVCTHKGDEGGGPPQESTENAFSRLRARLGKPAAAPADPQRCLEAEQFLPFLKDFIALSPEGRVDRISLNVCYSAGVPGKMALKQSLAQCVADDCKKIATSVTGRRGVSRGGPVTVLKSVIDNDFGPADDRLYATKRPNGEEVYVLNHQNKVLDQRNEPKEHYQTYIFKPDSTPELKPTYTADEE